MKKFLDKYDYEELKQKLFPPVLCDIMDQEFGYAEYAVDPFFRPVDVKNSKFFGIAYTLQFRETVVKPPRGVIRKGNVDMAVENVGEYDVVVMACQGSYRGSCLGELMSTACQKKGATGIVVDGAVRDVEGIREANIPVFSRYIVPYSGWAKLDHIATQEPVVFANRVINPGDIICGGEDGIIVIPPAIVEKVFDLALARMEKEEQTRKLLQQGMDIRSVFEKTGVL